MKKFIASLLVAASAGLAAVAPAQASSGGIAWDKFPVEKLNDTAALQRGAKLFVNYCLNCHAAAFMRYNRMRDIGLTEQQIKDNLMFATDKVGDTMTVALDPRQAKEWLGATPPDLTVIARSRAGHNGTGADYLYTYLRTYYRDETKATGWNNLAFPSVGMPHVLWELQGPRTAVFEEVKDPHDPNKVMHEFKTFEQIKPGKLSPQEFDSAVGDLVAFLQWMGEPAQGFRVKLGTGVLLFLAMFSFIAWRLNAAYWKDVK
ncbi:cytochrome c1 [Sphaerotilus uruguayifluvii]|uniref:Ubiquinol-cytochrome c reductase cytochrome c1 subunit n=1 Tax=Sphaerotilus uruguayifluvii TaxID=2735897 RepID=A0ABX2G836_9BURK|nr:cytochrome c1 [Leptothrix sp. C29]NRT58501.1 ubiquinol-cytochrome c reductase cytochrome c1 subunit [Leptothrix sp. C29]